MIPDQKMGQTIWVFASCTLLMVVASCSSADRQIEYLKTHFENEKSTYAQLDSAVLGAGYQRLQHGGVSAHIVVVMASEEDEIYDDSDAALMIRQLMEKTGVSAVSRRGDVLVFQFAAQRSGSETRVYRILRFLSGEPRGTLCAERRRGESGSCLEKLADDWWLSFQWFSD